MCDNSCLIGLGSDVRKPWWRHQMETFYALLALCEGNPSVTDGFPSQSPVTRSFYVFFDLHLNKRLSKQSRHRWFETPSRSLWRHWNAVNSWCVCVCAQAHITGSDSLQYSDTANLRFNCLFNTLSRLASKETSKLHITGPLWRESSPHKRTSNQVSMSCMASSCYHGAYWWICTVRYQAICRCSKEANVLYLHGGGTWEMQLILVIYKFISSIDILSIFWEMYPQVNACSQDLYEN